MKKNIFLIVFIIVFFMVPHIVYAKGVDVSITKVEMIEKSDHVTENSTATVSNNKLDLGLEFWNVGDYITYRVTFKNNEDEDYYLDVPTSNSTFIYLLSNNKIKKNDTTSIDITVKYAKKIADNELGKSLTNSVPIRVKDKNGSLINPKTGMSYIFIVVITLLLLITLLVYKNKKIKGVVISIIVISMFVPNIVKAAEKYTLGINVKYVIKDVRGLRYKGEKIYSNSLEILYQNLKTELESRCLNDVVEETQQSEPTYSFNDPYEDFGFRNYEVPDITFEATSENSADVNVPITAIFGNNQSYSHDLQTSVSIETDAETGDSRVVVGECPNDPESIDEIDLFMPYLTYDGKALNESNRYLAEIEFSKCDRVRELLLSLDTECIKKLIGEPQVTVQQEI